MRSNYIVSHHVLALNLCQSFNNPDVLCQRYIKYKGLILKYKCICINIIYYVHIMLLAQTRGPLLNTVESRSTSIAFMPHQIALASL